mgnify:CR=1 FL=1
MITQKKGHYSELMSAAILTKNNYDVFHPLQGHGPVDLVAVKDREIILLDIKTNAMRVNIGRKKKSRISRPRTDKQKKMGVRIAYLDIEEQSLHITDHDRDCQDAQPLVLG